MFPLFFLFFSGCPITFADNAYHIKGCGGSKILICWCIRHYFTHSPGIYQPLSIQLLYKLSFSIKILKIKTDTETVIQKVSNWVCLFCLQGIINLYFLFPALLFNSKFVAQVWWSFDLTNLETQTKNHYVHQHSGISNNRILQYGIFQILCQFSGGFKKNNMSEVLMNER